MPLQIAPLEAHPTGEVPEPCAAAVRATLDGPLLVDTHGRRFHVERDPQAPVTPLGQLVFFSQFLATAGLWRDLVQSCPLSFTSNNAPLLPDVLGTMTLAVLAGQNRYAHVTALRADTVNPQGLGMTRVCCEDSVRRAFADADLVRLRLPRFQGDAGSLQTRCDWQRGASSPNPRLRHSGATREKAKAGLSPGLARFELLRRTIASGRDSSGRPAADPHR